MTLTEIAILGRDLVAKVRDGKIAISEVTGGTFTFSDLGMSDVKSFTAILNPPQVAILAVAATTLRHLRSDGNPAWRQRCDLTLTCDHRAVDGAKAAAFLAALKSNIEAPEPAPE